MKYYPRHIAPRIVQLLDWSPILLLTGARQSGKTTLCKLLQRNRQLPNEYEYLSFDDDGLRNFALDDPIGFVDQLPTYAILDEIQLVPSIYRSLKVQIDSNRIPGRFLLIGSTQITFLAELADSLVGRMNLLQLYPLAQCEVESGLMSSRNGCLPELKLEQTYSKGYSSNFLGKVFDCSLDEDLTFHPRQGRELARRIVLGGYPEPRRLSPIDQRHWHRDYIKTIAYRDIRNLTSFRKIDVIPRLAEIAAAYTSQIFNLSKLAAPLNLSRNSVNEYVSVLQNLMVLTYLPAWSSNHLKRAVKASKLHFADTGLACVLLNLNEDSLWSDRQKFGQLAETLVVQEIIKQASWSDRALSVYHYRDRDRDEVDLVIENFGNGIVAIEVKVGASVRDSDFRCVRKIQQNSDNFIAGVVLYDGEWTRSFGENLYAVPISRIWDVSEEDSASA